MADAVRDLLTKDGVFTFEVSYLLDIVQKMLFDTIYHEHLCYHLSSVLSESLQAAWFAIDRCTTHSNEGWIASRNSSTLLVVDGRSPQRAATHRTRGTRGLHSTETFRVLTSRIELAKVQFTNFLDRCRASAKLVAGYGASPTVTTLLSQFDLAKRIEFRSMTTR